MVNLKMEENLFENVMKERSTGDLVEIVKVYSNDYQPEAVEAARKQLRLRNIDYETYELNLTAASEQKLKIKIHVDSNKILIPMLAFIFPFIATLVCTIFFSYFMVRELTIFITFPLIIFGQVKIYKSLKTKEEWKSKLFRNWTFYSYVFMITFFIFSEI